MQHERAGLYRSAGTLLAGAAAVAVMGNALHPRFDGATYADPVASMAAIEGSGLWLADHLVILAAAVGIAIGVVGLAAHLAEESRPRAWAWTAAVLAVIAGSTSVSVLIFDGIAVSVFAASAGAATAETATAITALEIAAFASLGLLVFGALPMVLGMAIVRSSVYPHWIGFVALAAGVVGIVMGVLTAVEGEVTTTVTALFLVASVPTTLVWLGMGLLLRQHGSRELFGAAPTATPA